MATNLTDGNDGYSTIVEGEDVNGKKGDDTITGDPGSNHFNGGDGNDTLSGMGGDDALIGNNGNDVLIGGEGNDQLTGNNDNDSLTGGKGNDTLDGGGGVDTLVGGEGDDDLTGGGHADTFSYSFTVTEGPSQTLSFNDWLADQGKAEVVDGATQNYFSTNYTAWLNHLVAEYDLGADVDGDGIIRVGLNQNDPTGTPTIEGLTGEELDALFGDAESVMLKTGKTSQERWFSDEFTAGGSTIVSSTDGQDTIYDFNRGEGDKLDFNGLTEAQFNEFFVKSVEDADSDGSADDTVITLKTDATWSLKVIGVTDLSAADFTFDAA